MIASIYFANEETSWENKQRIKDVCAALWGMMEWIGAKQKRQRKQLPPFVLYLVSENMAGVGEQRIVL